jgi:YggT family protein
MSGLVWLVNLAFTLGMLLIFARVFLSWGVVSPYHPVGQWIFRLTEPLLAPIRNVLPPTGMLDWSPMVALFLLMIVRQIVVMILLSLA